ncbi:microcystin-dependent protein [Bradyrhizobium barranii subsp. barranii]
MPLETATYVSDLVASNPAASDPLAGADDHLRLIKATLKATFPNFTSGQLNSTQAQLDAIAAALVGGVLRVNGACPAGALMDFAQATAPAGWLPCDGQAVSRTTYADLFAAVGTTWGPGDGSTTFNVPNLLSRYRRHRDNASLAGAVGTVQNPANLAHSHGVTGAPSAGTLVTSTDPGHFHAAGISDPGHGHPLFGQNYGNAGSNSTPVIGAYRSNFNDGSLTALLGSSLTGVRVQSSNGLDTTYTAGAHAHAITGAPGVGSLATASDGGSETRPYSATVLTCIKT